MREGVFKDHSVLSESERTVTGKAFELRCKSGYETSNKDWDRNKSYGQKREVRASFGDRPDASRRES